MYRPPQYVRGGGGGGGGGYYPPNYSHYPSQNLNFPSHGNFHYLQNPATIPQHHFQNPNFPYTLNPYPQNLTFPQPNPYPQNPTFPQPNPYLNISTQTPCIQSPTFPHPNSSPSSHVKLERIESAAAKAHHDLVTSGESVSAWKVSQSALVALKVDSWGSLGFQLQDIPSLHRLIVTEGKVNAFIHCFVGARRITSLYDLEVTICKNEGIERFEELGLGPLSRHPLVKHYFSFPSDSNEVFKITSEDIIASLLNFTRKRRTPITIEEFLDFLAEKKSVSVKEKLGVRIQSLGLYLTYIREAKRAEKTGLNNFFEAMKNNRNRESEEKVPVQPPCLPLEKQVLDGRFDFISNRIKSFSSAWDDFGGKHIRFDSSDDGVEDDDDDDLNICQQSSSQDKDRGQRVSNCPYPSTTEEIARLGLNINTWEKAYPNNGKELESGSKKSSGKKRKSEYGNCDCSYSCKSLKKKQVVDLKEDEKKLCSLTINSSKMEKFITTWKEACREHPVTEVLVRMVNFYASTSTNKQKKTIRNVFSSYPGLGLLNIAVNSIKCGMLDSLYDTFQAFGEHEFKSSGSAPFVELIEIAPSVKEVSNTNERNDELANGVSVDDIIKHAAKYFEFVQLMPSEKDSFSGEQCANLKKFRNCETWLMAQFSVKEFSSLGYGNFFEFLEKHGSLLPYNLRKFLFGEFCERSCLEASMLEQQLRVFLFQVEANSKANDVITKDDISMLLKKQFPTFSFHIVGNEAEKCIVDLIKRQKDCDGISNCVLFSTTLLGKQWTGNPLVYSEKSSLEAAGMIPKPDPLFCSFTVSSKDAIECLLKAPMLSDLLSWSHWDLIYAPSLGPLLQWLLNEFHVKELLCIATVHGKLIRIDHSATVDDFLEALIQCSSFQAAVKLLSLLSLNGGTSSAPMSLLKSHAKHAIDVIIRNSIDSVEVNTSRENLLQKNPSQGQVIHDKSFTANPLSDEGTSHGRIICESLSRINKAVTVVSRFILECLGHLPSEFRSFAAEILVSGLRSFTKDAPLVILHECSQTAQRLILHDIGLSLGITEWIEDYHKFSSTASADLFMFSKTPNKNPHSERSVSNNKMMLERVTAVASLTDGNHHTFDGVDKRKNGDTVENGLCKHVCRNAVSYEATSSNSGRLYNREVQDAIHIVESIRREEFGLDPNLNSAESFLLRKQHDRLGRALHCLSQELYSQDSHLLLELVQNADDNIYPEIVDPTLVFILQDSGIVVLNNEQGFSAQNIRALCDIGNSTKKGSSAGYIGHKGIGFKSVFRVTDAPEIHSNGFHVKFDITDGQIGFVLPTAISPCDINIFRRMLSSGDDKSDSASWNTCILLPFRSKFREGLGMNSIISMFSDLHPSLLLFLHRLQCIKFKNMLNDNLVIMRRETLGNGIIKVSHGEEKMSWLVVGKKLQASIIRQDVQTTEIAMAFTLQETDNGEYKPHLCQQPVFAFLPLRNYGLKFILQGDFVLPSSREEVDGDSAWNQWLLSEFPALFVIAEQSFCSLPCFQKNPGKAVTAYMSFVPLVAEVHGFFSHLPHMIISKLRISNCMLLDGPDLEWVLPCRVLRGWNEQARMLFSDSLLQKHVGLGYLAKDVILSDSLAKALGIQDYGPKVLIEIISSICLIDDDIKLLGLDWLSSWLSALYSAMSVHSSGSGYISLNSGLEYDLINGLKKIPFIPLSDGSYSSLDNGPIWLPCDVATPGLEGNRSPKDFPKLYAKLRTVNPLLFFAQTTNINGIQDPNANSLIQMLQKIGVQQLSAHDVIRSHILVALSSDTNICNEDRSLMIEYLSFVMIHFQHDCASCRFDKAEIITELRKKPVLLTNHGFKCPVDETIHFGKEYGNPVDIDKLLENIDLKWVVVDVTYLKHPSTQSLSFALMKWRDFFQELGVTDFVQVTRVDKNVPDVLCTISESMEGSRDLIAVASFINDWESPELVNLLSAFSLKQSREHSISLLEILDKMWDDCYSVKSRSYIISNTNEDKKAFESSFMKTIREFQWIASSMDKELHLSKDLFHDCEEVRSILGTMAPYAVPKLTSKLLLMDIGFKTQVSFDDALNALHSWRVFNTPFKASIVQMSKLYTFISDEVSKPKLKITEEFIASSFIFIPFPGTSRHDVVSGMFYSPKEVYWHDPTGCVDRIQEMIFACSSLKKTSCSPCMTLATIYPSLHDFFVNICGVHCVPPFGSYLQILLQLSTVVLPSQAAHVVFQVFLRWADDFKSESVKSEEVSNLREKLFILENTVLPTLQDKWVSLHPSFGTICWSDDEELKQQFKHSDGIDFLQFGELSNEENKMLSGKVATLLQSIGVPALSEIVSREAIFYGTEDNVEKASLINWVLSYAQRYLHKLYPDIYLNMRQLGFEKLNQLKVVVVDKLFYKHTLKGRDSTSKKRVECSCLLQGNILYATHTSDHHSMFLELSRLFFNGSAELHLANFLHMVTTMVESGSTDEQTEFFIVNSQKVPKLPDDELVWSLPSLSGLHECETPPLGASPMNVEQSMLGSSPMNVEQSISTSRRKPGISPNWPPRDWKTAPDFHYARTNHLWTRSGLAPHAPSQRELCNFPATVSHSERNQTCQGLPVPIEIDGDWSIEEGLVPAANTIVLEEPAMMGDKPREVESVGSRINPSSEPKMELVAVGGRGAGSTDLSASPERDRLCFENPDDNQSRRTGRIGEMIAYKYFSEKLGLSKVRWVNEATETGLPYDLVTGDEGEMSEYVEVKSTKSASKDWFDMSTREWQFAAERGDSFIIAHVVLLGPKRATITVMKNPLRLCQQNALRLAILMSRELRDSSVPS